MRKLGVPAGGPSRGRLWVVSIAVLAMLSPLGIDSSAQAAVAKPSPPAPAAVAAVAAPYQGVSASTRIRIAPSTVKIGQRARLSGKLPTRLARTVKLQQKAGTRWVTSPIKHRTTRTGSYAFSIYSSTPGLFTVRVYAPRARIARKMRAAYVTPARSLRVLAPAPPAPVVQAATLSMPLTMAAGTNATATMVFRPIVVGRQVALQILSNGVWTFLPGVGAGSGITTQSAAGTASLPMTTVGLAPGTYQYRAATEGQNGGPDFFSPPRTLTVT